MGVGESLQILWDEDTKAIFAAIIVLLVWLKSHRQSKEHEMRDISEIIVHCSATSRGRDVDTKEIRRWHTEDNGWSDIGYHFVIELDGDIGVGRPQEKSGAHCKGKNSTSIGVCYVGGVAENGTAEDTRTDEQKVSLETLLGLLKKAILVR